MMPFNMTTARPQNPHVAMRLLITGVALICFSGCARLVCDLVALPVKVTEQVTVQTTRAGFGATELAGRLVVDTADDAVDVATDTVAKAGGSR
jgi:hypothetical protein